MPARVVRWWGADTRPRSRSGREPVSCPAGHPFAPTVVPAARSAKGAHPRRDGTLTCSRMVGDARVRSRGPRARGNRHPYMPPIALGGLATGRWPAASHPQIPVDAGGAPPGCFSPFELFAQADMRPLIYPPKRIRPRACRGRFAPEIRPPAGPAQRQDCDQLVCDHRELFPCAERL
nr:hypothetical protein CFP56_78960 [Quercus suber]